MSADSVVNAGTLLRSLTFPASIHAVLTDPADHALYAAAGNGTIFETSLVGDTPQMQANNGAAATAVTDGAYYSLQAGPATVTCLGLTADARHMVSGQFLHCCTHLNTIYACSLHNMQFREQR